MGWLSDLFSPAKSQSVSTSSAKTEGQKKGLQQMLDLYLPTAGQGADIFPGARTSPFSTLQQSAISGAANFAPLFSTPQTAGAPLFPETGQAIKGVLSGQTGAAPFSAQDTASYFDKAIYDPTMKGFREDVVPGISEAFSGPGFWGSARSQELSKASQDVNQWLGGQRAGLEWDVLGRNQELAEAKAGRTLTAIPQAMNYSRLPAQQIQDNLNIAAQQVGGLASIFGIGQAEQTQAQRELQDEIMRFAEENQLTSPEDLAIIMGLLGLNFQQSQSTSSSSGAGIGYQGVSSFFGGFGGGLGQGMATPKTK